MTVRWWYLRRGVAWPALLGSCAAATLGAGLLARWPSTALVLLPALLACCAAGSAFVFDEAAASLVAVTPRGTTWRRTTRLAAAGVPLGVWTAVVLARPGDLPLDRTGWWLAGAATISVTVGLAGLASRRAVDTPGSTLVSVVPLAVLAPVVVTMLLGWGSVYPIGGFAGAVWAFWLAVTAAGVLTCLVALRPGVRP